jgi:hypothetical protein
VDGLHRTDRCSEPPAQDRTVCLKKVSSPPNSGRSDLMTDAALYDRITHIRADLLDVIGKVGTADVSLGSSPTVMQDDLIMVANRLGRVAFQLRRQAELGALAEPPLDDGPRFRVYETAPERAG